MTETSHADLLYKVKLIRANGRRQYSYHVQMQDSS